MATQIFMNVVICRKSISIMLILYPYIIILAETYVNGQRIVETTILSHGCTVRFGRNHVFRYLDPATDLRTASSVTLPVMSSGGPPQEFYGNYAPINRPNGGQNGYPAPPRGGPGHNMGQDNILPAVLGLFYKFSLHPFKKFFYIYVYLFRIPGRNRRCLFQCYHHEFRFQCGFI